MNNKKVVTDQSLLFIWRFDDFFGFWCVDETELAKDIWCRRNKGDGEDNIDIRGSKG